MVTVAVPVAAPVGAMAKLLVLALVPGPKKTLALPTTLGLEEEELSTRSAWTLSTSARVAIRFLVSTPAAVVTALVFSVIVGASFTFVTIKVNVALFVANVSLTLTVMTFVPNALDFGVMVKVRASPVVLATIAVFVTMFWS